MKLEVVKSCGATLVLSDDTANATQRLVVPCHLTLTRFPLWPLHYFRKLQNSQACDFTRRSEIGAETLPGTAEAGRRNK